MKEDHLTKFLPASGIDLGELNQTWLSTINTFGTDRGKVAHRAAKTQQPIDPVTELQTIKELLAGLKELDEKWACL